GVGVAGSRMAAAIAEGVELLDIAEPQPRLLLDPVAQADLEGAVLERIERAEGQACEGSFAARGEYQGLGVLGRHDRGGQTDLDRRQRLVAHPADAAGLAGIIRARSRMGGPRPSSRRGPSRRALAACGPRVRARGRRARRYGGSVRRWAR